VKWPDYNSDLARRDGSWNDVGGLVSNKGMATLTARSVRVWLPLGQLAITGALTVSNLLRPDSLSNPSWVYPDKQFCDGLNAPASLVRYFIEKATDKWFPSFLWFNFILSFVVYFGVVALTWYFLGAEIDGRSPDRVSVLTPKTYVRSLADALLVLMGTTLAVLGQLVRHQFGGQPSTYSNLVSVPYFVWATILIAFYGHDFWFDRIHKRTAAK
jgi:hypothetical protein